ncbi:MAG: TetR/AcrR family transcriptional regulator [Methylovirgula sp.]
MSPNSEQPPVRRPSGRPRTFDRDEALRVALDLFWRQGFEGTSTTQLTAILDITQTSLYAAFGSKEELFHEALALYRTHYTAFLWAHLSDANLSARAAVGAALLAAAEQFTDASHAPGCMIVLSGLQVLPHSRELLNIFTELRRAGQEAVRLRLETARDAGELPTSANTEILAAYFAAMIQGMAVQAKDGAPSEVLKHLAQLAMSAWPKE